MSLSQEQFDCLMLARSPRIGPVSYRQLIARFGSASAALKALPDLARRGGGKAKVADPRTVEREVNATIALGANYVFLGSAIYPSLLSEIDTAPPALIMRGRLDLLERHSVAMVGARNASAAACRFARMLAHDLGQGGYVTVSGQIGRAHV